MQITTVLTKAEPRIVNKRDGSGSFTLYELFDHEGTAWVVRDDIYNQARQWLGQTVDMVVRVEQKGNFTNRYADIVTPNLTGQVPASNAVMQAMQAAQQANRVQPSVPNPMITQPQVPNTVGGMGQPQLQDISVFPTRKDSSINRQTAAKVAAQISSSPAEFWGNCQDLARYFDSGQVPAGNPTSPPTGQADQAQFAMAGSGYDNSPPSHGDNDIPF